MADGLSHVSIYWLQFVHRGDAARGVTSFVRAVRRAVCFLTSQVTAMNELEMKGVQSVSQDKWRVQ